ncbi:NAD(P)(+) transhydrogenase (Re/Si-specific) subunit beta, partial [Sphingomonas adhaesiva]|uniref:NAD(P)(+) transhydrogenase (Re/Si-specific) subunit beta n=1 Tax=Sphingomonas adhaesiva TaxID=28212 RepID=UPI0035C7765F
MEHVAVNPWVALAYLIAGVCFILALRGLSSPTTSQRGNRFGMIGMGIAVVTTLVTHVPVTTTLIEGYDYAALIARIDYVAALEIVAAIAIGAVIGVTTARRIAMTAMPQLVAAFHSLVGLAAVLVAAAAFLNPVAFGIARILVDPLSGTPLAYILPVSRIEMGLGVAIGAITFSGSVIAFLKLNGNMGGAPIMLPGRHVINLGVLAAILLLVAYFTVDQSPWVFWTITILSFAIGFLLIIPIGGADMPVVVSMLNSYSGWAAAAMGFTLHNSAMIITGALVGSSGAILSYIMCRAMNRSFISVIAGGFGSAPDAGAGGAAKVDRPWKRGSAEDAAFLMSQAEQVIIVPGYGMAVAQAQHVLREMADKLKEHGVRVKYAIHPVAGRLPGHMNVLLAEAKVHYDIVLE